ncbi:MAG: hypothetical protein GKR87_12105 [Kiritimatiellae bacterium]|nr:hypothetical protein [Kiritimatiellia bacterium]
MKRSLYLFSLIGVLVGSHGSAHAQVKVVKAVADKVSIDLSGVKTSAGSGEVFRKTLASDLVRSGWFSKAKKGKGTVTLLGTAENRGGALRAEVRVYGSRSQELFLSQVYKGEGTKARLLAHKAADDIVKAIKGVKGIASTHIIMVGTRTQKKELYVCDADGHHLIQLTKDRSVSVKPRWGPKGQKVTYTSYLKGYPDIYLVDIPSGSRTRLSSEPGLNSGAAISPNGKEVALVLSKDGNPELYIKHLASKRLTRITRTKRAAEASPSWSPEGQKMVYVSDQSGKPQLYVVSRNRGRPQRLTSRGVENVAPDWGKKGWIAYACRVGGRYQICIINPNTREIKQITQGNVDFEDPSWAPDGRHIVCSRTEHYRSSVYILDTLGDSPIRLFSHVGDWFSPAWSPN